MADQVVTINTETFTPGGSYDQPPHGFFFSKNFIPITKTGLPINTRVKLTLLLERAYTTNSTYSPGTFIQINPGFDYGFTDAFGSITFFTEETIDSVLNSWRFKEAFPTSNSVTSCFYNISRFVIRMQYELTPNSGNYSAASDTFAYTVILGEQTKIEYKSSFFNLLIANRKFLSKNSNSRIYIPGYQEILTWFKYYSNDTYLIVKGINNSSEKLLKSTAQNAPQFYLTQNAFRFEDGELDAYKSLQVYISQDPYGFYPVTEIVNYKILQTTAFNGRAYRFKNAWGGWDNLFTTGQRIDSLDEAKTEADKNELPTDALREGGSIILDVSVQSKFKQESGWLPDIYSLKFFREFVTSKEVYELSDIVGENTTLPIKITKDNYVTNIDKIKFEDNQFDFEAAYAFKGLL